MASRLQKRMTLRRKFHILRTLTRSKSVKKSSIIMDTILYIYALKLKLEAIKREYLNLMKLTQEVKIEKIGTGFFVKVICEKGRDVLVSILEAFDKMGLNVVQARVSCNNHFVMEAITEAQSQALDVRDVTHAVLKAIEGQVVEGAHKCLEVPVVNESK